MRRTLGIAAVLLLLAIALQLGSYVLRRNPAPPPPALAVSIPLDLPGWIGADVPLGETEELKKNTVAVLQFDDFVSRRYRRAGREFTLYAAYWRPGKVPPRSVGVHTPDTCWIQNGWTRRDRDYAVPLRSATGPLLPAERGTYEFRGIVQHVLFWHLVGHEVYAYKQDGLHSLTAPLKDLLTFGLNQRREQLFVRLSSSEPFEQFWSDPGFQVLLAAFARRGLAPPETGS